MKFEVLIIPNTFILQRPTIIDSLKIQLEKELPGYEAQHTMAPKLRYNKRDFNTDKSNARLSSVLIPLYLKNNKLVTVLTQRPEYDGVHSKQVSFPGGRKEKEDFDIRQTALREAQEELGIEPKHVNVLGQLSELYIPPSKSLVTPIVGYSDKKPKFVPVE